MHAASAVHSDLQIHMHAYMEAQWNCCTPTFTAAYACAANIHGSGIYAHIDTDKEACIYRYTYTHPDGFMHIYKDA